MTKKQFLCGIVFFTIVLLITTIWTLAIGYSWPNLESYFICPYNLKTLWILSRKASRYYQIPFPPPIKLVKIMTQRSFLLTEREADYLGISEQVYTYVDFPLSLICPRDPKYLLKVAMDSQGLDYQPSYLWHPDARTLAYCPYCRIAVLLDGRIEKRR